MAQERGAESAVIASLSLEQYAEVVGALEEVPSAGLDVTLATLGISETSYRAAEHKWQQAMAAEMDRGEFDLVLRLAEARDRVRRRVRAQRSAHAQRSSQRRAGSLSVAELKAWMGRRERVVVFDMRFDLDDEDPVLPGAVPLNLEAQRQLAGLDRSTPIVFVCFHGELSRAAAQHYADEGFEYTYSVDGGLHRHLSR